MRLDTALYEPLASGKPFFSDLLTELHQAKNTIYIHAFLWRNDTIGRLVAEAVLHAADRGVQVTITKDRIGAFFEYAEGNGQSFWHDTPKADSWWSAHSTKTMLYQARLVAKLYGGPRVAVKANDLKEKLEAHPNITVQHEHKLYDHSKVVIIDEKVAYFGGVSIGDEFYADSPPWIDLMLKTANPAEVAKIAESTERNNTDLHQELVAFIDGAKESLTIVMSFMGHPDFVTALSRALKRGVSVTFITAAAAHSNRYRNLHFLKRLLRTARGHRENLRLEMIDTMVHGKYLLRDGTDIRIGSQNMVMDSSVVHETTLNLADPGLYRAILAATEEQLNTTTKTSYSAGQFYNFHRAHPWYHIILPSRLEWLAAKIQTIIVWIRREKIEAARKQTNEKPRG